MSCFRIAVCFAFVLPVVAGIGCSKTTSPPPTTAPPFRMPSVGDTTDSSLLIGDILPEMEAVDLDGNPISFDKQLLGDRCTLLVFWSTTCGFCMQEMPHEVELAKLYEPRGLRVIGVNSDETIELAKAAVKENDVPWLNVFEGPRHEIANQLGIKAWPTLILLDTQGKVLVTSPLLRSVTAEITADGSTRTINGLDWVLKTMLNSS